MSIIAKGLNFVYNPKSPFEKDALKDVTVNIEDGETVCMIGHTGSGKSTFVQHLNGLIRVQSGSLVVEGIDLSVKKPDLKQVRSKVGLVFQYPEYQLFADTVYKDVAFGPVNMKLPEEEVGERVKEALRLVGLDPEIFGEKSPFELSGGEKRRVALAGIIAMRPRVLVLDEPTAGLDPRGKKEILKLVSELKKQTVSTVIMINHDMNEVAEYATKVAVMNDGRLVRYTSPGELFKEEEFLESIGLELPFAVREAGLLRKKGIPVGDCITVDELYAEIKKLGGKTYA
jgi:energy-coupling factor transport system ATP-binding protein